LCQILLSRGSLYRWRDGAHQGQSWGKMAFGSSL
jgi:hypothetical protein